MLSFAQYKQKFEDLDEKEVERILDELKVKFIEKNEPKYYQCDQVLPESAKVFVF